MRKYLLDTNTFTFLSRGQTESLAHLQNLQPDDEVYTCFVVVGEWEYGILNIPGKERREGIRAAGNPIFAALTGCWDSTQSISLRYGALHALLRSQGQIIPINDLWIAATALENSPTLVTTDTHFQRISVLQIEDWTVV